jgi:phosphonatase-like hydrolase
MKKIDLVAFDMAGTTIEDRNEVLLSFLEAMKENRIPATVEELQKWRGASKREVLRIFIEQQFGKEDPGNRERLDQTYAAFRRQLENRFVNDGVRVIAGAEETFRWLRDRGIKVALTSGFYRQVADIILRTVGWKPGTVDVSICSDEVPRGRPAPFMIFRAMEATGVLDVRRVVTVGDTVLDLESGMNAGVRGVVGVLTGTQKIERLGKSPHTHIIASVAELPELLEKPFF